MKESMVLRANAEEVTPPVQPADRAPLISNFAILTDSSNQAEAKQPTPAAGPALPNSLEHFQLKQALVRAKSAGLSMREVAQLVATVFSKK